MQASHNDAPSSLTTMATFTFVKRELSQKIEANACSIPFPPKAS
jgi:hypothetical protein